MQSDQIIIPPGVVIILEIPENNVASIKRLEREATNNQIDLNSQILIAIDSYLEALGNE